MIDVITIALRNSFPSALDLRQIAASVDISGLSSESILPPVLSLFYSTGMARHVAGGRFPIQREMQRSEADMLRRQAVDQPMAEPKLLRDSGARVLRFACPRCSTITEIQTPDAIQLCGEQATLRDVADRLQHEACRCALMLLFQT